MTKEITEVKMGKLHFGMKLSGPEVGLMLKALDLLKKEWSNYKYQDMKDAVDDLTTRVKKVDQRYNDLLSESDIQKLVNKTEES